jgi:hypothetical protein
MHSFIKLLSLFKSDAADLFEKALKELREKHLA